MFDIVQVDQFVINESVETSRKLTGLDYNALSSHVKTQARRKATTPVSTSKSCNAKEAILKVKKKRLLRIISYVVLP